MENPIKKSISFSAGVPSREYMRLESNGNVFVFDETLGEMRKIDIDKELAQAFAYTIVKLTDKDPTAIIEAIRNGTFEK